MTMVIISLLLFGCLCAFLGFLFGEFAQEQKIIVPPEFYVQQEEDGNYYVYPISKLKENNHADQQK